MVKLGFTSQIVILLNTEMAKIRASISIVVMSKHSVPGYLNYSRRQDILINKYTLHYSMIKILDPKKENNLSNIFENYGRTADVWVHPFYCTGDVKTNTQVKELYSTGRISGLEREDTSKFRILRNTFSYLKRSKRPLLVFVTDQDFESTMELFKGFFPNKLIFFIRTGNWYVHPVGKDPNTGIQKEERELAKKLKEELYENGLRRATIFGEMYHVYKKGGKGLQCVGTLRKIFEKGENKIESDILTKCTFPYLTKAKREYDEMKQRIKKLRRDSGSSLQRAKKKRQEKKRRNLFG